MINHMVIIHMSMHRSHALASFESGKERKRNKGKANIGLPYKPHYMLVDG